MISKSWLFLELSIYSERVAKKEDTSSVTCMSCSLRVLIMAPTGSEPYDLRVHSRGCSTMFVFALSGLGMEN